jgi:hypothetical protein
MLMLSKLNISRARRRVLNAALQIISTDEVIIRHTEKSRMFEKFSCTLPTTLVKGCGIHQNKVPSSPNKSEGPI